MRRQELVLIAATALLFAVPRHATAQAPSEPPPPAATPTFGEQVEVSEVLLDAQVTDKEGNVIVGLGKDDFQVEEDGKPVALTDVRFYSSRPLIDVAGHPTTPAESQRFFILFFQDQRQLNAEAPGVLARELDAGRRARDWAGKLGAGDYAAVVSFNSSLVVDADFTRDRKTLQGAIDEAIKGGSPAGNWPSRLPPEGQPSLLRNLPSGNAVRDASPTIEEALQTLARAAGKLVGRKNLILFATGFGNVNSFGQYVPDKQRYEPMMRALNDANVAVYAVDLFSADTEAPLEGALSNLANQTGGKYYQHLVSFATPLARIAEETTGYYLLAYQATHPRGTSGYQTVKVTVKNPGFRVKAREGYLYGE
ncbi:MAG TPA: VWA domain-containing protein [Thermoanaerobaculia bacterium]|jgi:VWFA-related protein|nr:VWA domain-containing protein [Thermoanaerobaculia bacterium]